MPIYEFECSGCGHRFDRLQKLSDTDPTVCPACDAPHLRRMVSAPSFRLAGSGWYETDFKKDGDKKRNLAGDAGSSGDTKTPAADKPAATPAVTPAAPTTPAATSGTTSSSN
jgi:putative FmdB family regulatory protein